MIVYFSPVLDEYVEVSMEQTTESGRQPVVEAVEFVGETSEILKNESKAEHNVVEQLQQHHQQQLEYLSAEEGGDGVGVLEAGQPETENGGLDEPTVVESVATPVIAAVADHQDNTNLNSYTFRHLGYHPTHEIIHDRQVIFSNQ